MAVPSFDEARARLTALLAARGWPEAIRWIRRADILAAAPEPVIELHLDRSLDDFRGGYDQIAARAGAVRLVALCTITGPDETPETAVAIAAPSPGETPETFAGGLDLVLVEPRVPGQVRWPHC